MATFANTAGVIGPLDDNRRTTTPEFKLMTTITADNGYSYFYVQAGGAIAASQTDVAVTTAGAATDGSGTYVNTAAFASGEYGWVRSAAVHS